MPETDANLEMDTSDISALDDQSLVDTTPASPEPAASSSAAGESDEDYLSIAKDVIRETVASNSVSPTDDVETTPSDMPKEPDDAEYSDVPFHKHPRFQQLLRKSKANEQDAVRYNNVVNFLEDNGLAAEEAADALTIAGLMKTDPRAAWERLKPTVQHLLVLAGEIVPDDLSARVNSGEISRDAALEIARARATSRAAEGRWEFEQQRQSSRAQKTLVQSLTESASAWEQDRKIKDPNYAAKENAIRKEIIYLHATEGKPTTPEGVKAQLQKAYKTVNDGFRPPVPPAPRPAPAPRLQTTPSVAGKVASNPRPQSGSTLDVIRANRQG